MRILITGGGGFIGSAIATTLAKKTCEVVIYDIAAWDSKEDKIEYIKGDVFDVVHLTDIVRQCDGVIHMVGLPDARIAQEHPQMSFEFNVGSLQVLLEAAKNNSITRLILPSSAAIYGVTQYPLITEGTMPKPTSIYAYHKYVAEKLAEAYSANYNVNIVVMRLFNVYGANGAGILNILLKHAIRGEPVKLYGEKQKRDFIHVSDVADAFVRVLELDRKFEVYNVGTGVGRSIQDIGNLVKEYFPNLTVTYGDYKGVFYDSVADITKLINATGFNPDGTDNKLRDTIEATRQ